MSLVLSFINKRFARCLGKHLPFQWSSMFRRYYRTFPEHIIHLKSIHNSQRKLKERSTLVLVTATLSLSLKCRYTAYGGLWYICVAFPPVFMFSVAINTFTNTHTNSLIWSALKSMLQLSVWVCVCIMCVCGLRGGVGVFWGQEVKYTIRHSMLSVCFLGRSQSRTLYQFCNNQKSISSSNLLCWSSNCCACEELPHVKQAM